MVARNFSLQDYPYSRLLQVPDDEREFLTLEELKPHQLTELGVSSTTSNRQTTPNHIGTTIINNLQQQQQQQHNHHHHHQSQHHQHQQQTKQQHNIISGTADQQQQSSAVILSDNNNNNNNNNSNNSNSNNNSSNSNNGNQNTYSNQHNIYFDLNTQQTTNDSRAMPSVYSDISQGSIMESSSHQQVTVDQQQQSLQQMSPQKQHQLHHQHNHISSSGKRKNSFTEGSDLDDELGDDAKSIRTTDENKKQNHSEIEKRRRDKMNTYITELSSMVPMCHAMSRKLDKLTVLRMAVQHLKTIRGAVHSYTEGHYKPAFLSDQELKMLILQAADGFLFVVGCDRGRILYVSASVSQILNYSQGELLGQSWFDILHPKDVAKVKEQLSSSDLSPRERLIDAKTMLPVKTDMPQGVSRLCPGARRSFFCRMKCKLNTQIKEEADTTTGSASGCHRRKKQFTSDKKYSVIQCTGYLKSWAPAKIGLEEQENDGDSDSCNLSCLVAVGRIPPNIFSNNLSTPVNNPTLRSIQFISRHAMDGKFIFIDQRATLVLGFLPQELLGTSMYEYYHHEDIPALAESHKAALQNPEKVVTPFYRFRTKDNGFIQLQSEWKSFKNPWTKDVENLVAKNSVILNDFRTMDSNCYRADGSTNLTGNFDFFTNSNGREMQRMINTHVEASKIGRQIAEQVLDYQRRVGDTSSECSPDPESTDQIQQHHTNQQLANDLNNDRIIQNQAQRVNGTLPSYNQVRNNSMINSNEQAPEPEVINMISGPSALNESTNQTTTNDGNDEAAMAVIMSLLEADAGLGGPVDFTGLPWPLP